MKWKRQSTIAPSRGGISASNSSSPNTPEHVGNNSSDMLQRDDGVASPISWGKSWNDSPSIIRSHHNATPSSSFTPYMDSPINYKYSNAINNLKNMASVGYINSKHSPNMPPLASYSHVSSIPAADGDRGLEQKGDESELNYADNEQNII